MLTPDQIDALRDRAGQITDPITEFLLEDIARRIAEAGQLTSTASYQIWHAQQLGLSQKEIKTQLKKLLDVSNSEIEQLLTQSAEVGYSFDIRNLPHAEAVPFAENTVLQQIVSAAVELAQEDFTNLTQTIGMVDPYGNALPLQDAYRSCTDFAFKQVITGATDYNTAIRRATKNLADQGLLVIDYESGVHTSLEAAVRRNIMGGLGLMQEKISRQNHDDFGCDGWEISAHANSAPDHEPIQGKQYSDAEYESLNNSLVRRIGTLNCGHAAFPIILGVDTPQYTSEELEKFRQDNADGVTVDGKHYTGYEATQMQRKIERTMRKQKRRILTAEATGDKETLSVAQTRLHRLRQEYTRFSNAAGLRTQDERAQVAGFGHKEAARASKAAIKQRNQLADVSDEYKKTATPGVGAVEFDVGYKHGKHKEEIKIANWLHDRYGGDIKLLNEADELGVKMPDYSWRGRLWELKTITTERAADDAIRRGMKQIDRIPGGIVLDYGNHNVSMSEILNVVKSRVKRGRIDEFDIMVLRKDEVTIFRYKK